MVCVGCDRSSSLAAIEVATAHHDVWATVGLHPHEARHGVETIIDLLDDPRVVAVGECGLDYHYDHSPRAAQRTAFAAQIGLALERDLPLVVHTREAWDDTFAVFATEGVPRRTVFHCFTGDLADAERCWEIGASLSFSGIVTFKNATGVQQAARHCPSDRLMIETDSPYLAPVPHRGRPNRPAYVRHVAEQLAALRGQTVDEVAELTFGNTVIAFSRADS